MAWLGVGLLLGPWIALMGLNEVDEGDEEQQEQQENVDSLGFLFGCTVGILVYAAPAIGGFVVVSQMLIAYGNCIRIS
jgi:hypothetical protein